MIRIFLLTALLGLQLNLSSQCQTLNERDFQSAKQRLQANSRTVNVYQAAVDLGRMYCLTSTQAREIATGLNSERDKFDFLKSSFPNIADKENFTDVMDAFRSFSIAFKLYHHTIGASSVQLPPNNPLPVSQNPNCQRAMDQNTFQALMRQTIAATNDRNRAGQILNSNQCMMTAQIIQLTQPIRDENIKIDVLKRLIPFVFDIENYRQAANMLSTNNRTIFLAFLQNPNQPQQDAVTEIDFGNFISAIKKQSFEGDKENYIKTYMKNAYLTTNQIKTIINLMTYDSSKLDIAKFLYTNCVDKQNYFNVAETMQFSSSKNDLNDFVKGKM